MLRSYQGKTEASERKIPDMRKVIEEALQDLLDPECLRVSGSYQPVSGWRELLKTKGGNRNAGETDQEK